MFFGVGHVGRQGIRGRSASGGAPPTAALALDFMAPGVLDPLITFTRASTANYFDSSGTMQTAAVNAPRWDYDPSTLQLRGLLLEDQRANSVRNSTMVGAVPGTPGTLPTNWLIGGSPAVVPQVVATGTESGIPYIDLRLTGTATSVQIHLLTESTTAIVAANGQAWTSSMYIRLVAGTLNGITSVQPLINEATAAGAGIKTNSGPLLQASGAALASQRGVYSVALTGGGTVGTVHTRLQFNITNGAALEATFRIGAPQMELGDFATSFIPTSTVAVTRNIDSCLIPSGNMSWFTPPGGSWFAEYDYFDATPTNSRVIARPNTAGGLGPHNVATARTVYQYDGVGLVSANTSAANTVLKAVSTWTIGQAKICLNGGVVSSLATLVTGYNSLTVGGIGFMSIGPAGSADNTSGHIRAVRYWPTILSDAQMQSITA